MPHDRSRLYWAKEDAKALPEALDARINDYYTAIDDAGRIDLWRRAVRCYYGYDADGGWKRSSAVTFGGDQGELVGLRVNDFASLIRYVHTLITGNRPALQARAANDDPESYEQTIKAEGLLEYYLRKKRLEDALGQAALWALYWGEGWVHQWWDLWAGRPFGVDPNSGTTVYEGDVAGVPRRAIDIIRDPEARFYGDEQPDWLMVRRPVNRFELLAQYPQIEAQVLDLPPVNGSDRKQAMWAGSVIGRGAQTTDYVYVYDFYHRKTLAMPEGRLSIKVGDVLAFDGPLPYDEIPLHPIFPEREEDTPFGHTPEWDLMAPQECLDMAMSTVASNFNTFGVQNIQAPQGCITNVSEIAGGMRYIETNPAAGEVKPLNLLPSSKEGLAVAQQAQEAMQRLSGINNIARGNTEENVKSGAHAALLQSMSVQYNSGYHAGYGRMVERLGNALLKMLQNEAFVPEARQAEIVGRDNMPRMQTWKPGDIRHVTGVIVELANPLAQTIAGRREMANEWRESGWVQSADQHSMVIATGRLEPLFKRDRDHRRLINAENERLRQGQEAKVAATDWHLTHALEHACVLDDPDVRYDDGRLGVVLGHIQEHLEQYSLLKLNNPDLLAATGDPMLLRVAEAMQALMATMPPTPPPGAPGPAPAEESAQQPAPVPALEQDPTLTVGDQAGMPSLPNLPEPPAGAQVGAIE